MRRILALLVTSVLALCAWASPAVAAAPQAQALAPTAQEAQQAETACGPGGAGDQLVPDQGPWFNFTAACANHDACYAAQLGQANCDNRFRDEMNAHCRTRAWYQRSLCHSTAGVYYDAVRRFGYLFY